MAQPSKVLSLFPRPSGDEGLVLSHMGSLASGKEGYPMASKSGTNLPPPLVLIPRLMFLCLALSLWRVSDGSRQMSLPLNGFGHDHEMEPLSYSPEQADSLQGPAEDWPDWSDPEESENRGGQSVQIHIQASEEGNPVRSRLSVSNTNMEEEPWDDFEDAEPTSDLSPTAPLSDPVILAPPTGGTTTPARQAPEALRPSSSKPLKLTTAFHQPTEGKTTSSWEDGWAQEERDSRNPLHPQPKATVPQKNSGTGGLGEEFTIKVKKKVEQDPELDLFADMVPDIRLSSPALLDAGPSIASSENVGPPQLDPTVDTVTLTAKFAAANLTEVS